MKNQRIPLKALIVVATLAVAPIWAVSAAAQSTSARDVTMQKDKPMTDGEIRKVDKSAGKLTIKHGEIKNLEMPAMTMVFQVGDKAMLDQVKQGDKVRFIVIEENGKMVVTELEPAM